MKTEVEQPKNAYDNDYYLKRFGDVEVGVDLLDVGLVATALADTLAFIDLKPPFVMAILGGWGTGKSYMFDLMLQRFMKIQEQNIIL